MSSTSSATATSRWPHLARTQLRGSALVSALVTERRRTTFVPDCQGRTAPAARRGSRTSLAARMLGKGSSGGWHSSGIRRCPLTRVHKRAAVGLLGVLQVPLSLVARRRGGVSRWPVSWTCRRRMGWACRPPTPVERDAGAVTLATDDTAAARGARQAPEHAEAELASATARRPSVPGGRSTGDPNARRADAEMSSRASIDASNTTFASPETSSTATSTTSRTHSR